MANSLNVGPNFASRLALCHAVSCLEDDDRNIESVKGCLSDMASVLGDVSDTLAILSDYSIEAKQNRGMIGISDGSIPGATRLMSDVVALCSVLTNTCNEALPCGHGGMSDEG